MQYEQFKAILTELNNNADKAGKALNEALQPYKRANGFVGRAVFKANPHLVELEKAYQAIDSKRKAFITSVPVKTRNKWLRQMSTERRAEKMKNNACKANHSE